MYAPTHTECTPTTTLSQPAPAQAQAPMQELEKTIPAGTRTALKFLAWWEWRFHQIIGMLLYSAQVAMLAMYVSTVVNVPELLEPPYSPAIMPSLVLPLFGAALGIIYILSVYIPKLSPFHTRRPYWLGTAILRGFLIILFILGAALQSTWMALPLGSCEKQYYWRDSTGVPKGTLPVFYMLPDSRMGSKFGGRTQTACDRLVMIWGFEITTIILLALFGCSAMGMYRCLNEDTNEPGEFWQKMKISGTSRRAQPDPQQEDLEIQPLNRTYQRY